MAFTFEGFKERIMSIIRGETKQRAIDLMQVGEELSRIGYARLDGEGTYGPEAYYLSRIMVDDSGMYAVYSHLGRLYRAQIQIVGTEVSIGEMQEVEVEHRPIGRTWIRRDKHGDLRLYMVAGVAAINRDGEIDSRDLFDSFVRKAEASGFYPKIDWYHMGSEFSLCDVGQCDFVARAQNAYVASGVLDESNPLTPYVVERVNKGDIGCSIEYYPMLRSDGTPDTETIFVGDVPVTVYRDGLNTRIALLPEQRASHIMTTASVSSERIDRMTAEQAQKLRALFNSDEEFEKFASSIAGVERGAADAITRETNADDVAETPAADVPDVEAPAAPDDVADDDETDDEDEAEAGEADIELSDELVGVIAQRAADAIIASQGPTMEALAQAISDLNDAVSGQFAGISERLAEVEKTREQDVQEVTEDLSARVLRDAKLRFTYRPSEKESVTREQAGKDDVVDVDDVLGRLPDLFERNR